MREKTIHAAKGRWEAILTDPRIGIEPYRLDGRHHECPQCGHHDGFRFDNQDGSGSWICSHCDPQAGYGIQLVMRTLGLGFPAAADLVDEILGDGPRRDAGPERSRQDPTPRIKAILAGTHPLDGTDVASRYLKARGVQPAGLGERVSLGHHPGLDYYERRHHEAKQAYEVVKVGTYPAMVAILRNPKGQPGTLHVTYLAQDGSAKAPVGSPKKILSSPPEGGAIRLWSPGERLVVAEGIETAMAAAWWFQEGAWATYSADFMEKLQVPDEVREVVVVGDNDRSFRGQAAAYALAHRVYLKRKAVTVVLPPDPDTDFLDMVNAGGAPRQVKTGGDREECE